MSPAWVAACCSLLMVAGPTAMWGQSQGGMVRGIVRSQQTGAPISDVIVRAVQLGLTVRTDTGGFFQLMGVGTREFVIQFRRLGFAPLTLTVRLEDSVDVGSLGTVTMEPVATRLEAIIVEGEAYNRRLINVGYYDRRKFGFGSFVDREAIEEMNPNRMTEVVRSMKGFTVVPNQNYMRPLPVKRTVFGHAVGGRRGGGIDTRRYVIRPRRGRGCPALVFVDGIWVGNTIDTDIDRFVHPSAVLAIEAYSGPSIMPAEFNRSGAECGALVIWTR